jgi:hypothetical protein
MAQTQSPANPVLGIRPCPGCGAASSQFDLAEHSRHSGTLVEVTCRKCGYSVAQLIVSQKTRDPLAS